MAKHERAPVYAVKRMGRLEPASQMDAEAFETIANGSEVEIIIKQKRNNPRLRLYWAVLGRVVAGGFGPWGTKESLSDALKMACDVVETRRHLDGRYYLAPDSLAFGRMSEAEFSAFMERAFAKLADHIGEDPMALLPMRRAA